MENTIETVFRCVIYFDVDTVERLEGVTDTALKYGRKLESCVVNQGGPCHGPYIEATDPDRKRVVEFDAKVKRYILKRKGTYSG